MFTFVAREHVRNHPRWDPDIELEATSDAPISVGTIIRRVNKRSGTPVHGTMEVVEFHPDHALAMVIREGPLEIRGRTTFEPISSGQTRLTITADIPTDPRWDRAFITSGMQRTVRNIKGMVEAER